MIGKTISHFRITKQLGAGGMGVVYEAVDLKLDRTVALKFLPPELTRNREAKARFVHEAKAASAMDHPNVCTLYEVDETDDGQMFLAMAYYDGETLRDRIAGRPLAIDEALDITRQIAEGLAKAHASKIVHRDIKPANVIITSDGLVKILDFGLAKLSGQTRITRTGTPIGTANYMSPEQARGEGTDQRTDLWCLGVALHEMVTGLLPFRGDSQQAVIYAILNEDPAPVSGMRTGVPLELERIIEKCLAKDPAERYQHADDLVADLRHLKRESSQGSTMAMRQSHPEFGARRRPWVTWGLSTVVLAVVLTLLLIRFNAQHTDPERLNLQFDVLMPYGVSLAPSTGGAVAMAPEDNELAYVGIEAGRRRIYLHRFDEAGQVPVPRTEDATCVAFSPDGQWLAFATLSRLSKIHLETQRLVPLCLQDNVGSINWSENDSIYFASSSGFGRELSESIGTGADGIYAVHASGGEMTRLTAVTANDSLVFHSSPTVSEDGQFLVYAQRSNWAFSYDRIMVRNNHIGTHQVLIEDGGQPILIGSDRLLFMRNDDLMHVFVDLDLGTLLSDPITVQTGIFGTGIDPVALATNGSMAFITSLSGRYQIWDRRDNLALVDRDGDVVPLDCDPGGYALPSFSPDGKNAAFTLFREMGADIWAFDLTRGVPSLLTRGGSNHVTVWTPDGRHFIYSGDRLGKATQPDIFIEPVDGSEAPRVLVRTPTHLDPVACSPDGKTLVYWDVLNDTKQDLFLLPLQEPGDPTPYLQTSANEAHLAFSPDGKYVAYTSDESGDCQVYVKPFQAPGGRIQISATSGRESIWHPSGQEIFFLASMSNQLYSVAIDRTDGELTAGKPLPLWNLPIRRHGAGVPNYALHPDGERFLVILAEEAEATKKHIHVALGWQEDLERRLVPRP